MRWVALQFSAAKYEVRANRAAPGAFSRPLRANFFALRVTRPARSWGSGTAATLSAGPDDLLCCGAGDRVSLMPSDDRDDPKRDREHDHLDPDLPDVADEDVVDQRPDADEAAEGDRAEDRGVRELADERAGDEPPPQ